MREQQKVLLQIQYKLLLLLALHNPSKFKDKRFWQAMEKLEQNTW